MFPLYQQGEFIGACSMFTDITELNHLTSEVQRISQVAEEYNQEIRARDFLKTNHIIGESEVYLNCIRKSMMVASTDASVLIRGENGTGKEVICKIVQENSARRNQPFIKVNCAAIPEALIESELFGYEEGSFTGLKKVVAPENLSWLMEERFFWMRSAICRWQCRQSCCVYFRKARLKKSVDKKVCRSMCV